MSWGAGIAPLAVMIAVVFRAATHSPGIAERRSA
jgi:hypothetical protein